MGQETSWTLIDAAAKGDNAARAEFARIYEPVIRNWLGVRWRGRGVVDEIDDAAQQVFLQCLQDGGVLERVDPNRSGGFRAFFYGVIRRVAQKVESDCARQHRRGDPETFHPEHIENDETTLTRAFDRSWAKALMKEAWELNQKRARQQGDAHLQRVDLLRLRFQESLPIREIAKRWNADSVQVHRDYARARKEFKVTLREVVGLHEGCAEEQLAERCDRILLLLG